MSELVAYSTFVVTMGLAISRPRVGARWQVSPGAAALVGMLVMLGFGIVRVADVLSAASILWRPFVTIVAIMAMTAAARQLGVLERLAEIIFRHPDLTVRQLYVLVFVLSAGTASLLNNDAAVLLLTPVVIALVQRRYPGQRHLLVPFAFVVFMAAGVAPFVVSNPMNMIVAASAGLDFNTYALRMVPISIAGWIIAFVMLQFVFGPLLVVHSRPAPPAALIRPTAPQTGMLLLLLAVLGSYPFVASVDPAALWIVSSSGAVLAVILASVQPGTKVRAVMTRGIAWEVLVFLLAVFVIGIGLRNVGLVQYLATLYDRAGVVLVGTTAAFGSALLNNHPMAIMNLLALQATPQSGHREILAALIGGDLGPRLLPIGSLAGLLWLDSCRQLGVEISLRQFIRVGCAVTLPALAVSLAILALGG